MGDPKTDTGKQPIDELGANQLDKDRQQVRSILDRVKEPNNPEELTDNLELLEHAVRDITSLVTDVQQFADFTPEIKQLIRHTRKIKKQGPQPKREKPPKAATPPPPAEPDPLPKKDVEEIARKAAEREAKRKRVQTVIDKYSEIYKRNKGRRFSQMLGCTDTPITINDIIRKFATFTIELNAAISVFASIHEKLARDWSLSEDERSDLQLHQQVNQLLSYITPIFENMVYLPRKPEDKSKTKRNTFDHTLDVIIDFDAAQNGQTPPPPKQERTHQVDHDEQVIIISLLENLRNVAHTEQNPLQVAHREIDVLFSRSPSIPTWFRFLKTKLENASKKVGNNPYDPEILTLRFDELHTVDSRLTTLFAQILQSALEKEQKKWQAFETEYFTDDKFTDITQFLHVTVQLDLYRMTQKTQKPIPSVLMDRWKSGVQRVKELLKQDNFTLLTSSEVENEIKHFFTTRFVREKIDQLIFDEIKKRKKEEIKAEMLPKLNVSHSLFEAIDLLRRHSEFSDEHQAIKNLQNYFELEGKKQIFQEKQKPNRIIYLRETDTYWKQLNDLSLRHPLEKLFESWALEQQEKWWREVEEKRNECKRVLQEKTRGVITTYITAIMRRNEESKEVLTPQQLEQFELALIRRMDQCIGEQVNSLDVGKLSGNQAISDIDFIQKDERFNEAYSQSIIGGNISFQFDLPTQTHASPQFRQLSAPTLEVCQHIAQQLKSEETHFAKATSFSSKKTPGTQNPSLLAAESYSSYLQRKEKSTVYFELIVPVLLARLLQSTAPTELLQNKNTLAKRYLLQSNSFVAIAHPIDQNAWRAAEQQAKQYIQSSFGFSSDAVDNAAYRLQLPQTKESLLRLLNDTIVNDNGIVNFVDPQAFFHPTESDSTTTLGFINTTDYDDFLFGIRSRDFEWRDASPERRKNAIEKAFTQAYIQFDIIGSYRTGLLTSVETRMTQRLKQLPGFAQSNPQYFNLGIQLSNLIGTDELASLISELQNESDKKTVIAKIYEVLNHSPQSLDLAQSINRFVDEQTQKAMIAPEDFLNTIGLPGYHDSLTQFDWFNICYTLVRGRFDDRQPPKVHIILNVDRKILEIDMLRVLQYARNLRSAA